MFFWRLDEPFLRALDALGGEHTVRVAYYVRPQHTAIESWWCEAGFRQPADRARRCRASRGELHYLQTLERRARSAHRTSTSSCARSGAICSTARTSSTTSRARSSASTDELPRRARQHRAPARARERVAARTRRHVLERHAPSCIRGGKLKAAAARLQLPASDADRDDRAQMLQAFCHEIVRSREPRADRASSDGRRPTSCPRPKLSGRLGTLAGARRSLDADGLARPS